MRFIDFWFNLFNSFTLKIKLLTDDAVPIYMKTGDACMDAKSRVDVVIMPKTVAAIPLGFAVELPYGYELQVRSRSGLGKEGLVIPNGIGTIDSGYRGEVHMLLYNTLDTPFAIIKGDRIAQITVSKVPHIKLKKVRELKCSERGTSGFGSTGK